MNIAVLEKKTRSGVVTIKLNLQFNVFNKASGWGYSSKSVLDEVTTAMALVTCEGMQ